MKTLSVVLSLSSLAASALLAASISAQAATQSNTCRRMGLSPAECSCQHALNTGSSQAIQLFLRQYPFSDTACNALNSTATRFVIGDGTADKPSPNPPKKEHDNCENDWKKNT